MVVAVAESGQRKKAGMAEGGYDREFRTPENDAWYSVQLVAEGEALRVKFLNFPDDDIVFQANDFRKEEELVDFSGRFRKISVQLQDRECSKVVEGMLVCASLSISPNDLRFYDAVVEDVRYSRHSFVKGEEECSCIFVLFWQHGPEVGKLVEKGVESICLVRPSAEIDPIVASFMEIARQKIKENGIKEHALCLSSSGSIDGFSYCSSGAFRQGNRATPFKGKQHAPCPSSSGASDDFSYCGSGALRQGNCAPAVKRKQTFAQKIAMRKCATRSSGRVLPYGGRCGDHFEESKEDTDVEGATDYYAVFVQNLEKNLSPSTVLKFIYAETSITSRVYVAPSLPWQLYTTGVIVVDSVEDLIELYAFLKNPHQIILSSTGRPWVVDERMSESENNCILTASQSSSELVNTGGGVGDNLSVVHSGTTEFNKAKKLRDLFLEFIAHHQGVLRTLELEEKKVGFGATK